MRKSLALERERHASALEQGLSGLVRQLRSMPSVQKVILFGSYAAGSRDLFTDLDLLVVMDSEKDFVQYGRIVSKVGSRRRPGFAGVYTGRV